MIDWSRIEGAVPPDELNFAPVFKGWNVWAVAVSDDLDFDPLMLGVSDERRLRIWVEDEVRLHAAGAEVADPLDLKGGQVETLAGVPEGLRVSRRKEQVPGPAMLVDAPATVRIVRFFNRGASSRLPWPHDDNFLLDQVFEPSPTNAATSGPAPSTIASPSADAAREGVKWAAIGAGVLLAVGLGLKLFFLRRTFA